APVALHSSQRANRPPERKRLQTTAPPIAAAPRIHSLRPRAGIAAAVSNSNSWLSFRRLVRLQRAELSPRCGEDVYALRLRLLLLLRGHTASTLVVKPPRGVNSPVTRHLTAWIALTISRSIRFTAFS